MGKFRTRPQTLCAAGVSRWYSAPHSLKLVWVCSLSVGSTFVTQFFSHSTYLFATNAVYSIEFLEARLSFEKSREKTGQNRLTNIKLLSGFWGVETGTYERVDTVPSIEFTKPIADVFRVSLDYLAGEGTLSKLDKKNRKAPAGD